MSGQIASNGEMTIMSNDQLEKAVEIAGYAYDSKQDIFYSTLNPWQRKVGYCRLYDEAAAPLGMIIDSEPIHFEYNGQKWMIGLWKGQYDLVTGGEIGVYIGALDLKLPGVSIGTFYHCASDEDLLPMSYTLRKNGKTLFTRSGKHWWLTGFKLGEFSEPSELTMDISITLKNRLMRDAFLSGLRNAGYSRHELFINNNTVSFRFGTPYSPQPITRTPATDRIIQKKNKLLCDKYLDITRTLDNLQDKVSTIEEQAPELYRKIMTIGKAKPLYEVYETALIVVVVLLSTYLASRLTRQ